MLIAFFAVRGIVYAEFLAPGPDNQPAHLQGCPATFDAVSARQEATNV